MIVMPLSNAERSHRWIASTYRDIDAQAAQLQGYEQHYQQLSRGRFQGRMASLFIGDDVSVHVEQTNQTLTQYGRSPGDRYSAVLLSADSRPGTIDGTSFHRDYIALWPPGHHFEAVTFTGMTMCVVSLARRLMSEHLRAAPGGRLVTNSSATSQFRHYVTSALNEVDGNAAVRSGAAASHFAADIAQRLEDTIHAGAAPLAEGRRPAQRKLRLFRQARDRIHSSLSTGVSIAAICAEVGLSRRSLEKLFVAMLDTTPAKYVRALQLNMIRRSLLSGVNTGQSIGDIAAAWGVWHWSRFSSEYRLMFAELPSQTRRIPRVIVG
jgi:AraC family ethanolamine operon transcriptional activator